MKLKFKLQALLLLKLQQQEDALLQYARSIQQKHSVQKKYEFLQKQLSACEDWIVQKESFSCQQHVMQLQQLARLNASLKNVKDHLEVLQQEEQKRLNAYLLAKKDVAVLEKLQEKSRQKVLQSYISLDALERENWVQGVYRRKTI
jgi:flagellar biosynthesis chaperone FliJ